MGIFDIFRRSQPTAKAKSTPAQDRANLTIKGPVDKVANIRKGLKLVKERRGLNSQIEAAAFLIDAFKAHEERALMDRGIPTIKGGERQSAIALAASELPAMPKISLAERGEVARRIETCRKTLKAIEQEDRPAGLRWSWVECLKANERLMALLTSGLPLENRKTAGVLVDGEFYYCAGAGTAKMPGVKGRQPMSVDEFLRVVRDRSKKTG